jgi:hypothetical protein
MDTAIKDELESIVDRVGLDTLLDCLSAVCDDKAEHLASNWQDGAASKCWESASWKVAKLSCDRAIVRVS